MSFMKYHIGGDSSWLGLSEAGKERISLYDYKELFDPVIEMYHTGYKKDDSIKHFTDVDVSKVITHLHGDSQANIICTGFRNAENVKMFPLNQGGTKESMFEIAGMIGKVFATIEDDLADTLYTSTSMTSEQTQSLVG